MFQINTCRMVVAICVFGFMELAGATLPAQEPSTKFLGHRDEVRAVEFSPDGKILASASEDGTVILWDITAHKQLRSLSGHLGQVYSLAFSSDGKTLAAGAGKPQKTMIDIAFSGINSTREPSCGETTLWEISSGKEVKKIKHEKGFVEHLIFVERDKVLIAGLSDGSVDWFEASTGRRTDGVKKSLTETARVIVSPDGQFVAWAVEPRGIQILDKAQSKEWKCQQGGVIVSLAATTKGRLVASGTAEINLWSVDTGEKQGTLGGYKTGIFALAFSPNGKILASGSGHYRGFNFDAGEIWLWDVAAKKQLATISSHNDLVSCLAFSPDGTALASGSADGSVHLWRMADIQKAPDR